MLLSDSTTIEILYFKLKQKRVSLKRYIVHGECFAIHELCSSNQRMRLSMLLDD